MITTDHLEEIRTNADCVCTAKEITAGLDKMAKEITHKLKDTRPIVLCVMTGALIPMGQLLTRLNFPLEIDYLHATRYRGAVRGGDLHWLVTPHLDLKNRTVLVVDDILDGGLTLSAILDFCKQAGATAAYSAVILDRVRQREEGIHLNPDFVGIRLENEDRFLFGFGLDYKGYWRNLQEIYAVKD